MNRKYLIFWLENVIGSQYFSRNNEIPADLKPNLKIFANFLLINNAFNKYFANVYYSPWWQGLTAKLYGYEEYWFLKAFEWDTTPQGYKFWQKLNNKWRDYLSDKNKFMKQIRKA